MTTNNSSNFSFPGGTTSYLRGDKTFSAPALTGLSDVSVTSPSIDQVLRYDGTNWVNGSATTSSSSGINFYFDDTNIIPISTGNVNEVNTLGKIPSVVGTVADTWACANNTVLGEAYLYNSALGRTSITSGPWIFNTYSGVNSTGAGRVSYLTQTISRVRTGNGTVTATGSGTTRTINASTDSPFATSNIDTGGTLITDSYLQTQTGLYRILSRVSDTQITISTPSGYSNENTVSFSVWKSLFNVKGPTITSITPSYSLQSTTSVQPTFTTIATDKLGCILFATSNNTTNVTFVHSGNSYASYFSSPLVTLHDDLDGLQGGTSSQYYHLTSAEYTGVGTGNFVRAISPPITGTSTNDNAASGIIGEYVSSTVLVGNQVSLTTATPANITSISLTAGDWDVSGTVVINPAATTLVSRLISWTSSTSASVPTYPGNGSLIDYTWIFEGTNVTALPVGVQRISLASTTTVYLSTSVTFTTSTCGAYGIIHARRVR